MPEETQQCTKCGETKPLSDYRRQSHRPNGRDTICRACRKKAYEESKKSPFGPLPEPAGSEEWVDELWRRAKIIREKGRQDG